MVSITYISQFEASVSTEDEYETGVMEIHFKKPIPQSEWWGRNGRNGRKGPVHFHKFYNPMTETIGRGLLPELKTLLDGKNIPYRINANGFESCGEKMDEDEVLKWSKTILNPAIAMRSDQAYCVSNCLRYKQLISQLPTGYGKSMVIYGIARRLIETSERNILIVVPRQQLVSQMYLDFKEYGWDDIAMSAEVLHGELKESEKPTFEKRLLISTWQSLGNIRKREPLFFERYQAVIIDEVHKAEAEILYRIVKACTKADYRQGFTGTMPPEEHDSFMVQCHLGPVCEPFTYEELKEMGILSDCEVRMIQLDYPPEVKRRWCRRGFSDEIRFLEECEARHQAVLELVKNIPKSENTLVMFNHTEHLKRMLEVFKEGGLENVQVIQGKVKVDAREKIRTAMEKTKRAIVFATYGCVQEGINIKKLHNVVFAAPSKSKIRVLQTTGRGLRIHETKEKAIIWDLYDDFMVGKMKNHTILHAAKRFDYYSEQGFQIERSSVKIDCLPYNGEEED
jgi:superfamily II DNA or RNA helicase